MAEFIHSQFCFRQPLRDLVIHQTLAPLNIPGLKQQCDNFPYIFIKFGLAMPDFESFALYIQSFVQTIFKRRKRGLR